MKINSIVLTDEQKVINIIKSNLVYKNKNFATEGDHPALKQIVEDKFKYICIFGEENPMPNDSLIHNFRLSRKSLKKYLTKRYNGRLANKISALFDWSNNLMYKSFYQQLDEIMINAISATAWPDAIS
jgi:hypothetical protein